MSLGSLARLKRYFNGAAMTGPDININRSYMQTKFYGLTLAESDIPRFQDGTPAILEEPAKGMASEWRWTDGGIPRRVHPASVSPELVGRMVRANYLEWGWTPEEAEQEALLQERSQRLFLRS